MMNKSVLGQTGLEVTELCLGALPFGPLQKNVDVAVCTAIVSEALRAGIHFIDTAQMYRTYEPIKRALKETGIKPVIASKSTAADYDGMQKAIDEALLAMEVETVDIFHLHAARTDDKVFTDRAEAIRCLTDNKKSGKIRAVGLSSHSVLAVEAAAHQPAIDVVFPILNISGIGILHGNRDGMEKAIASCAAEGKGLYLMKALGGGSLILDYDAAMTYARSIPGISSVAVGMVSLEELSSNLAYFSAGSKHSWKPLVTESSQKRFMVLKNLCNNCGSCRLICPNDAIQEDEGQSFIHEDKCLTCGYCVSSCPLFAIRMI